jgi:hypothetical protein
MSNTSTVSPYLSETASSGASVVADATESVFAVGTACVIAAAAGSVVVAQWLAAETPEDRIVREKSKVEQRKDRLSRRTQIDINHDSGVQGLLTSVSLCLRDPETLVRSAEGLGYRVEPLDAPTMPLQSQPHILLRSSSGERLAISRDHAGRVLVAILQTVSPITSPTGGWTFGLQRFRTVKCRFWHESRAVNAMVPR